MNTKHRKYFYSNKAYLFYLCFISYYTVKQIADFIPNNVFYDKPMLNLNNFLTYDSMDNELSRIALICFIVLNHIFTTLIEILFNKLFPDEDITNNKSTKKRRRNFR